MDCASSEESSIGATSASVIFADNGEIRAAFLGEAEALAREPLPARHLAADAFLTGLAEPSNA